MLITSIIKRASEHNQNYLIIRITVSHICAGLLGISNIKQMYHRPLNYNAAQYSDKSSRRRSKNMGLN